jgi:glycosyltransferase involved in cell wall biosynthesis
MIHIALFQFYRPPNPDYDNIASGLRERGHTVWLGSRNEDGDLEWHDGERLVAVQAGPAPLPDRLLRVPLVALAMRRIQFFRFMLRVRGFLRQARPDIVQVLPASCNALWALPMLMPANMRFIFDVRQMNLGVRTDFIGRSKEWGSMKVWWVLARFVYDVSCFNHASAACRLLGERWSKWATVVPVGLSPRFLSIEHGDSASGGPGHPVRFIYVGALTQFRDLEVLLSAIQRVLSKTDRFRVLFVGPDMAQGFYHEMAAELDLNGNVMIEPPVPYERVPELLASHDVGLAYVPDRPTWHLQPTIKVLEYRAAGLPILSTDVASHREVVEDGVNGLLVRNSVENLTEGMLRFIDDRDFLERCQMNAIKMRQAVTIGEVSRMYEQDVYQKLLETDHVGLFATDSRLRVG